MGPLRTLFSFALEEVGPLTEECVRPHTAPGDAGGGGTRAAPGQDAAQCFRVLRSVSLSRQRHQLTKLPGVPFTLSEREMASTVTAEPLR